MALNLAGYLSGLSVAGQAEQAARGRRYEQEARDRQEAFRLEQLKARVQQPAATQPINFGAMVQGVPQLPVRQMPQASQTIAPATPTPVAPPTAQAPQTFEIAGPAYKTPTPGPSVAPRGTQPAQPTTAFPALTTGGLRAAPPAAASMGFGEGDIALMQRALPAAPAAAPTAVPQNLVNAVVQVESGGDPNAVSPKGARGLMQLMPETAKNPGFGITPARDNSPAENLRVGTEYLNAMLQKYNGNLDYALAAYNWGPGNTDRWIAQGADPAKLPAETRAYIPKVKAAMGQAPTAVATAQPTQPVQLAQAQTGTATDVTAGTTGPSNYYLANPQAIPGDMQRFMRQRDEIARMAGMYQRAGMGNEFTMARQKLQELDENMYYLQGMQGLQEFSLMNDPRRLSAVWSHFAGAPIGIQPRSDGKFDLIINGQRARQGLSAGEISQQARLSFDQPFRQQFATASAAQNMKTFEAGLEIQKENAKQLAQMIREVAVERLKGTNQQALEWYKANAGWDIKPTGAGDGTIIIRPPGQGAYLFNPSGRTIEIDGIKVQSNAAYPIAGLPTYGGMKP